MKKLFIQCVCIVMVLFCFGSIHHVSGQVYQPLPGQGTMLNTSDGPTYVPPSPKPDEPGMFDIGEKIGIELKGAVLTATITLAQFATSWTGLVGEMFDTLIIALTPRQDGADPQSLIDLNVASLVVVPWKIIRDVASIVLIFSLLYLGIKTILDGQGFADKKTLASIIVAAILLNFSLILTKDIAFYISNYIGREVLQTAILNNQEGSFTAAMMQNIGPQELLNKGIGSEQDQIIKSGWGTVFGHVAQTIVLVVVVFIAALIFLVLIGQLLIRFLVFVVLMITSPLGIIARTIPWLSGLGKTWWDELRKQTIYFPAFVFTMYIVFLIIGTLGSAGRSLELGTNAVGFFDGLTMFFINFALIIGFLLILIIIPGKLSEGGSSIANKAGSWTRKKITSVAGRGIGAATFGSAAMVGRNTVGRYAAAKLKDPTLLANAQNAKGFKGTAARALLKSADKAQNFSFDARATKLGGDFAKKHGLGEASKGWKGTIEDKKKAYKEKMEKEKKLYGFTEPTDAQKKENRDKLNTARADRDNISKEVEDERKRLAETRKNNPTDTATINLISESLEKKEKELAKFETEVGKLMQAGDSSYINYLKKKRHSGLNMYTRLSRTQKAALQALEKDMAKEWQNAGKAKPAKQKKPATRPPVASSSGAGTGTPPASSSTSSGSPTP